MSKVVDLERLFDLLETGLTMKDIREFWEFLKEREALTYRFRAEYVAQWLAK